MAHVTQTQFAGLPLVVDANALGTGSGLQSGDILIHHRHVGGGWDDKAFHASTVAIQTDIDFTMVILYDSMPGFGVRSKFWPQFHDDCSVFRPAGAGGPAAGAAAGLQAEAFRAAGVGYSSGFFGVGRAILCGIGSKKFGSGAKARLQKYHGRDRPVPKNCVCSEYVVLCYQLALAEGDDHFIKLDAKYTTPWDLESYLLASPHWTLAGAAKGKPK